MAKPDQQQLLTSVILAPDETGDLIGRVLDEAVTVLHAQMQRGELPAADFQRRLAEMQFIRDDVVSRAEAGQQLPNGDRLCYLTPESIDLLRTTLSAVLAAPSDIGIPIEQLTRLQAKFVQASTAFRAQQKQHGEPLPGILGRYQRVFPFIVAVAWLVPTFIAQTRNIGGVAEEDRIGIISIMLVFYLGLPYFVDFLARRYQLRPWLRLAAIVFFPYSVWIVLFLLLMKRQPQSQPAVAASASAGAPTSTTTSVPIQSAPSAAVISRPASPTSVPSPELSNHLDVLRQRSTSELEQLATALFHSSGFQKEQSWPTANGGFELVLGRDGLRALVRYQHGDDAVPLSAVQEFYRRVRNDGAERGYILTTGYGDPDAVRWASEREIEFIDGPAWIDRLREANLSL